MVFVACQPRSPTSIPAGSCGLRQQMPSPTGSSSHESASPPCSTDVSGPPLCQKSISETPAGPEGSSTTGGTPKLSTNDLPSASVAVTRRRIRALVPPEVPEADARGCNDAFTDDD